MSKLEVALILAIGLMVAFLIAIGVDQACAKNVRLGTGQVVERVYTPEYTNVGTGVGSDGGVVTTVSHEPEHWLVIVRFDGERILAETSADSWETLSPGGSCQVFQRQGKLKTYGYKARP